MVDIHSHIVWGVDDGPGAIEDSLAILGAAFEAGTTDIVATPHANPRYVFDRRVVELRVEELAAATAGSPKIHLGCEFHLCYDNIDHLMEDPVRYTINARQYLLVECPDFHIGRHTESVLKRLVDAAIVPIVAHPERNPVLRSDLPRVAAWVEMGCLVQLTALSITGGFGSSAKGAAMRLLNRGLVHVIASDAHDPVKRHPCLGEARRQVASRFGAGAAQTLFGDNPRAVIEGASLSGGRQLSLERPPHWYEFWRKSG